MHNTIAVITDRKRPLFNQSQVISGGGGGLFGTVLGGLSSLVNTFQAFVPEIVSTTEYYPFGMQMPGRSFNAGTYRYGGAGGQEMDNEISGVGNSYTAMFWQYDSRLGRRWNVDPIPQPWQTNYQAFHNNPIKYIDPFGLKGRGRERRIRRGNQRRLNRAQDFQEIYGGTIKSTRGKNGRQFYQVDKGYSKYDSDGNLAEIGVETKVFSGFLRELYSVENNEGPDLIGGSSIPNRIQLSSGTVNVTFGDTKDGVNSDRLVKKSLVKALVSALEEASTESNIHSIHISASTNGVHGAESNHYVENGARALDISKINSKPVISIQKSEEVKALQKALDNILNIRENFGPHFNHKLGKPYDIGGHKDHIHFSINK